MQFTVNTDGGSRGNPGHAGYGFVIADSAGNVLLEQAGYLGSATNNVAEYTAVVAALEAIAAVDPQAHVLVRADSKLVVEQLSGAWKIKNPVLQGLALRARRALPGGVVVYQWVPRAQNAAADALANRAMDDATDFTRGSLLAPSDAHPSTGPTAAAAEDRLQSDESVTLVLVRHGVTEMTTRGEYSGGSVPGPPLAPEGRRQVEDAAQILAHLPEFWEVPAPVALWTSPNLRAQDTAGIIGSRLGLAPQVHDDLREGDFGAWQGLTADEINDGWPGLREMWHRDPSVSPPGGGESLRAVADRLQNVAERALAAHAGGTVVLACHNVVIRAGVGMLVGMEPAAWYNLQVPPASVTILRYSRKRRTLLAAGVPSALGANTHTPDTLF